MVDSLAILAIVVLNAALGFCQEYRAARAVVALARLTAPRARVIRGGHAADIAAAGVALSAFASAWYSGYNLTHARDAAFSVLVVAELLRAFGARSDTRTIWQMGLLSNRLLCVIVVASLGLQLALHHLPALQALFGTAAVSLSRYAAWMILGSIPLIALEVRKVFLRSSPGQDDTLSTPTTMCR